MPVRRPGGIASLSVDIGGEPSAQPAKRSGGPQRSSGRHKGLKRFSPYKKPPSQPVPTPSEVLGNALKSMAIANAGPPLTRAARASVEVEEGPISARTRARLHKSFGRSGLMFVESKLRYAALAKRRAPEQPVVPLPPTQPSGRPATARQRPDVQLHQPAARRPRTSGGAPGEQQPLQPPWLGIRVTAMVTEASALSARAPPSQFRGPAQPEHSRAAPSIPSLASSHAAPSIPSLASSHGARSSSNEAQTQQPAAAASRRPAAAPRPQRAPRHQREIAREIAETLSTSEQLAPPPARHAHAQPHAQPSSARTAAPPSSSSADGTAPCDIPSSSTNDGPAELYTHHARHMHTHACPAEPCYTQHARQPVPPAAPSHRAAPPHRTTRATAAATAGWRAAAAAATAAAASSSSSAAAASSSCSATAAPPSTRATRAGGARPEQFLTSRGLAAWAPPTATSAPTEAEEEQHEVSGIVSDLLS